MASQLAELRVEAGLSGTALGRLCGWTHSKTSRIENGRTPPSPEDIRRWCAACGATDSASALIARSRTVETQYIEWRRRMRMGLRQAQYAAVPLFRDTRRFRAYSALLIPSPLQTEGYIRALLESVTRFRELPDEVEDAVAARVKLNRVLHAPGRTFAMVIEEAALHCRVAGPEATAAQLGHLMAAAALPSVSLGIIPADLPQRIKTPTETFHMYDDGLVSVELVSARVRVTQPQEIALYEKAFAQFGRMAVYGARARALIVEALRSVS
ncbi:helix-turn-helix domain-containing protein [Streptomyces sp. BI20]|uniref:helix-turn-helix domain-containing protein n=1 Tax=Streptomyces sp. BI20 TaxID=3403460 RepID=UPI003C70CB4E